LSKPNHARGAAVAVATLGLVAGLVSGSSAAPAADARTQARDTLFPGQGNAGYDVRSYDVSLDYAPLTNRLDAVTTIRAKAHRPRKSFHLDLEGMNVGSVVVDGTAATWLRRGHELIVTPDKEVDGRFVTTVTYAGTPREHTDADGSTEGWVRTPDGAVALGQPVGAMTWLPSNNTPGDKATYTFRITAPNTHQVAANGDLARKVDDGTQTTWVWKATDPMSTYVATVAIGLFDVYESSTTSITGRAIPIWSFADPTTTLSAKTRNRLETVIRFEEKRFGPYPFTSAGMIVDNADVGYALETQTRPFYPGRVDTLTLVHEMAHQWYGDSVTVRDWHDLWLAEGFATYAEWLWDAAHGGRTPAEHFAGLYAEPAGSDLWHPAPTEFTDPADLFGRPVYDRGAMTLQVLRQRVGTKDFFTILRQWAKVHRHGNARTRQLEALAESISGKRLDALFDDWLRLDGRPGGY
jgi:aminopeptidase N